MIETSTIVSDFQKLVLNDDPLVDVRAPVEHEAGSFPHCVNLPIMDNEDRHLVGICYKQHGREAAFALGHKRVSGLVRQQRIDAWVEYIKAHPQTKIFCFRGGMRSKTAQRWIEEEAGILVPRLSGGYKAFRRFLIEAMAPENVVSVPVILGGRTGCGKTILLKKLANGIDLEGAANHRGSAFGGFLTPQPTQINFENRLAFQLIKHKAKGFSYLVIEDEGSYIGSRYIPLDLAAFFKRDSMVILELELQGRIELTHDEYVAGAQKEYCRVFGNQGLSCWFEDIREKFKRIRKRLGGERLKRIEALLEQGYSEQEQGIDTDCHRRWVEILLR